MRRRADERQRNSGDRHEPDDHPHVDEQLEQEHRREPGPEQEAERVTRRPGAGKDAPQERPVQHEHDERADEPELLREHGEHEVALLDRQELAAALGAVGEPRPEQAARPDRDLRLEHLPARALRVGGGVEEREDPVLLVVAQHVRPGDRDHRQRRDRHRDQPAQARPGHEQHPGEDRDQDERGAEVRLEHHEHPRRGHQQARPRGSSRASPACPRGSRGTPRGR